VGFWARLWLAGPAHWVTLALLSVPVTSALDFLIFFAWLTIRRQYVGMAVPYG
jgi:hypothetical protein